MDGCTDQDGYTLHTQTQAKIRQQADGQWLIVKQKCEHLASKSRALHVRVGRPNVRMGADVYAQHE